MHLNEFYAREFRMNIIKQLRAKLKKANHERDMAIKRADAMQLALGEKLMSIQQIDKEEL